ncbi:MAG: trigger factor [Chloroflexota bacterium]
MKVATQEIENSQVVLDIEVEDERLEKALGDAYRRVVNRINVPGFRKGKAPRVIVERMVGRAALVEEAVERLVPIVVDEAVKEQALDVVAQPRLELVSTEPLQVKATVPVQPKVELGDYASLKIERAAAEVDDEAFTRVIDRLREQHATWEPVDRAVALGDRVGLDLKGTSGEQSVADASNAEYVVDPEGPEPAPGFSEQLIGLKEGDEKSFTLTYPEDYRVKDLASQPADFAVKIHWVKEHKLPEVDDDFAATVDGSYENAEKLKSAVRDEMLEREKMRRRTEHEDEVINKVVEQATVALPPQLIEEEAQRLLNSLAMTLSRTGLSLENYLQFTQKTQESLRAELMEQGEQSVRRSQVLVAVAEAEGLAVSDEEVKEELASAADTAQEAERMLRTMQSNPAMRRRLERAIQQRRAARFLIRTVGGIDEDEDAAPDAEASSDIADAVDDAAAAVESDEETKA